MLDNLHPFFVHFPVALTLLAFGAAAVMLITGKQRWFSAVQVLLVLAALGGIGASWSGEAQEELVEEHYPAVPHYAMENHEEAGEMTRNLLVLLGIFVLVGGQRIRRSTSMQGLTLIALALASGYVVYTGKLGGELVYQHGAGVQPLMGVQPAPAAEVLRSSGSADHSMHEGHATMDHSGNGATDHAMQMPTEPDANADAHGDHGGHGNHDMGNHTAH